MFIFFFIEYFITLKLTAKKNKDVYYICFFYPYQPLTFPWMEHLLFLGNIWHMTRTIISNSLVLQESEIWLFLALLDQWFPRKFKSSEYRSCGCPQDQLLLSFTNGGICFLLIVGGWRWVIEDSCKYLYGSAPEPEGARRRYCSKHFIYQLI